MENFSNIINSQMGLLEKRTLGGVTTKSAETAIKNTGKEAEKIATETEKFLMNK